MINQKNTVLSFLILMASAFSSLQAIANDFGLAIGARQTSANVDQANVTANTGIQVGAVGNLQISSALFFRTGFLYTQRNFTAKFSGSSTDYKFNSLDIPVTLLYKFSDHGGFFFGPIASLNQSKSCDSSGGALCTISEVTTPSIPISLGVSFKFAPQMGAELIYEIGPKKFASGVESLQTVGANFIYYFE